jgi:hypothetical protein
MNPYTNIYGVCYSGEKRMASIPILNKATAEGGLPPIASVPCRMCGQMEGVKQWHCEDYDNPVTDATCLCWHCHMKWHSRLRNPKTAFKYFYEVTVLGKRSKPFFLHNSKRLDKQALFQPTDSGGEG